MHVKTGDKVQVIAGKNKGATGKVLNAFPKMDRVIVEGVNILTRHKKPQGANQQGGIVKSEGAINASNVLLFCPKCDKGVRTSKKILDNGKKVRVCSKCGEQLDK